MSAGLLFLLFVCVVLFVLQTGKCLTLHRVVLYTGPKLGEGYFGVVIKAKWREMEVCVKRLKNVRKGEFQNFWSEVSIAR